MKRPEFSTKKVQGQPWLERFRKSSFPPAAVLGAFASFLTTAFRTQPESRAQASRKNSLVQIGFSDPPRPLPMLRLEMEYKPAPFPEKSAQPLRRSLSGLAVDSADRIYVLGDGEVAMFAPDGKRIGNWKHYPRQTYA